MTNDLDDITNSYTYTFLATIPLETKKMRTTYDNVSYNTADYVQ